MEGGINVICKETLQNDEIMTITFYLQKEYDIGLNIFFDAF